MRKIVLMCSAGMSTSMLVQRMRQAAEASGYECSINAYSMAVAKEVGRDADTILMGPQVRFSVGKVQKDCPGVPVEAIEPRMYGTMDGKAVLEYAKKKIGD